MPKFEDTKQLDAAIGLQADRAAQALIREGQNLSYSAHSTIVRGPLIAINTSVNGKTADNEKVILENADSTSILLAASLRQKFDIIDDNNRLKETMTVKGTGLFTGAVSFDSEMKDASDRVELRSKGQYSLSHREGKTVIKGSGTFLDGNDRPLASFEQISSEFVVDGKKVQELDSTIYGLDKKKLGTIHQTALTDETKSVVDVEVRH